MNGPSDLVVAEMTLRALLRRRLAIALLLALPVALYLTRRDAVGQSVRALVFGASWAVSTVAFFAAQSARQLEPRLSLAGLRTWRLVVGRVGGLLALGALLAGAFWVVVALDQPVRSQGAVGLDLAVTVVLAVALGTAIGAVVDQELEGALVIFFLAALQAVANPFGLFAKFLPFWATRELGTYAVDGPAVGSLPNGLAHAGVVVGICAALVVTFSQRRLGRTDRATRTLR
ncbi:MAG: hypothetical protein KDB21_12990 [Acidimicrobiales bacterium]|nr:hypothetical protein [Acidimicrobiales bacterium]